MRVVARLKILAYNTPIVGQLLAEPFYGVQSIWL